MKNLNKSTFITGVVLLLIAALFSISLFLQLFDFGAGSMSHNNILYSLGNILFSVYGFSCLLIPAFLLVAGLSCFATKWSARKTLRLLTAIIPFFTAVITENIIRSILDLGDSGFASVKIAIAVITGLMLIVIEYLGIGLLADKLNSKISKNTSQLKKVNVADLKNIEDVIEEDEDEGYESSFEEEDESTIEDLYPEDSVDTTEVEDFDSEKTTESEDATTVKVEPTSPSVFDSALSEVKTETYDFSPKEETGSEASEPVQEAAQTENAASVVKEPEITEQAPEEQNFESPAENVAEKTIEEPAFENENDSDSENPQPVISQEEYAALTSDENDDINEEVDDEGVIDELEWPGLPPQPDKLPPEYDEDYVDEEISDDDPALQFPPVEEAEAETEVSSSENALSDEENAVFPEEAELNQEEAAAFENNNISETVIEPEFSTEEEEENPYSAAKYLEKAVETSKFPAGIKLVDDDEQVTPSEEEKKTLEYEKPKFPSKIRLDDNFDEENEDDLSLESEAPVYQVESKAEPSIDNSEDDYVEDETLPFPDIPDSFDDDSEEPSVVRKNTSNLPGDNIKIQRKNFSSAISSVFEDMENDIRNDPEFQEEAASQAEEAAITEEALNSRNVSIDGTEVSDEENVPTLKPHSATNLTADELTDFFDAQQKENTPTGKEIAANPPKIGNRATQKGPYVIPSDLLTAYKGDQYWIIDDATKQASLNLKQTLSEFNIEADITGIKKGPVVTMFEILPAPGVKLSKIVALQDNIALSLAAQSVRIVAPIPGKQAVGIEVPNKHRSIVGFREIIEMDLPEWKKMAVPVILGKDILGKAQLIDLVKTPHMLIAGATGSGKSVCVNSLILSILYKRSYKDVKLILVDPKVVELKLYNGIPHLLTPVITEPKKALQALQYCLCEMERRYALLDSMGVRDISTYNQRIMDREICTEKLPYIVVIIDEFADLMATSGRELESTVARLTAMSRAVGIHLVLATQRPSVNVITGLIKANIPSRIAFMVSSRTDSNIIIDSVGAEKLLGRGDMLYASAVDPAPVRIQGTFVSDQEVEDVVKAVKEYGEPDYIDDEIFVEDDEEENENVDLFGNAYDEDPLYDQALEIVIQAGKASASYIQRRLKIGYNRAARLVEEMEDRGIVGPANGSKPREIIHVPS